MQSVKSCFVLVASQVGRGVGENVFVHNCNCKRLRLKKIICVNNIFSMGLLVNSVGQVDPTAAAAAAEVS